MPLLKSGKIRRIEPHISPNENVEYNIHNWGFGEHSLVSRLWLMKVLRWARV